jgi:hypothetical protein
MSMGRCGRLVSQWTTAHIDEATIMRLRTWVVHHFKSACAGRVSNWKGSDSAADLSPWPTTPCHASTGTWQGGCIVEIGGGRTGTPASRACHAEGPYTRPGPLSQIGSDWGGAPTQSLFVR